jgi:hypothetical protein
VAWLTDYFSTPYMFIPDMFVFKLSVSFRSKTSILVLLPSDTISSPSMSVKVVLAYILQISIHNCTSVVYMWLISFFVSWLWLFTSVFEPFLNDGDVCLFSKFYIKSPIYVCFKVEKQYQRDLRSWCSSIMVVLAYKHIFIHINI